MANHLAKSPPADVSKAVGFYALYAAAFSFLLVRTLNLHPLFSVAGVERRLAVDHCR